MSNFFRNHPSNHTQVQTEVIAICSAVGGTGKTAVTVNLASLLAQHYNKVRVIDGDLQFGDLALAFDLKPSVTIKEIVERKDFEKAADYCMRHHTGVELLPAPERPEHADLVTPEALASITESLRVGADLLLVDTQAGLTEQSLQVMEKADRILIVTHPGMAALKNTRLMLETLDALEMKHKVNLVVNKSTNESIVKVNEIPGLMQLEKVYFLPSDLKHVSQSLDIGRPVVEEKPKISFSKGIEKMVDGLFPSQREEEGRQSSAGFVNKWMNKVKETRGQGNEFISKTTIKEPGRG